MTNEDMIADLKQFISAELRMGLKGVENRLDGVENRLGRLESDMSHGLQYGVPLKSYVKTLRGTSFAPFGITDDPEIRTASSVTDYIMRRLALDYLSFDDKLELGLVSLDDMLDAQTSLLDQGSATEAVAKDEPAAEVQADQQQAFDESGSTLVNQQLAPMAQQAQTQKPKVSDSTAPLCYNCGNQTQRSGSCYVCTSCGSTTGCS